LVVRWNIGATFGVSALCLVAACSGTAGHADAVRHSAPARTTVTTTTTPPPTSASPTPTPTPTPKPPPARTSSAAPKKPAAPFAHRRIIAFYGSGTAPGLGVLGRGTPEHAWSRLAAQAAAYDRPGQPAPLPAFELIATIAQAGPGPDGQYREREPAAVIDRYLRTVRAHHGLLILDIQPGRSDFLTEARALAPWLRQPDVSLALDAEWRMAPGQIPGKEVGSVSAAEVNTVSAWLDRLVVANHLPPKVFLLHKFRATMLRDESAIANRPHLYEVVNMDGYGSRSIKLPEYHEWAGGHFPVGIKLFYRQDPDLLSPADIRALAPSPVIVDYQ
jgi:hypothetical protein